MSGFRYVERTGLCYVYRDTDLSPEIPERSLCFLDDTAGEFRAGFTAHHPDKCETPGTAPSDSGLGQTEAAPGVSQAEKGRLCPYLKEITSAFLRALFCLLILRSLTAGGLR